MKMPCFHKRARRMAGLCVSKKFFDTLNKFSMTRDTPLGFPAHPLPYRRRNFITLPTVSGPAVWRGLSACLVGLMSNCAAMKVFDRQSKGAAGSMNRAAPLKSSLPVPQLRTTASMCARTCSAGQSALAMCSTQKSISCSLLLYLNSPSA